MPKKRRGEVVKIKRIVCWGLAVVMGVSLAVPTSVRAAGKEKNQGRAEVKEASVNLTKLEEQTKGKIDEKEEVEIFVRLEEKAFTKETEEGDFDLTTEEGRKKKSAYGDRINQQMVQRLEKRLKPFQVLYTLDLLSVGFRAKTTYENAKEIAKMKEVRHIEIASQYKAAKGGKKAARAKNRMANSLITIESSQIYSKYSGKNQIIAIVDSGADVEHKAFQIPEGFSGKLTKEKVDQFLKGKQKNRGGYINAKFPYVCNYADGGGTNVKTKIDHGQHIAGIIGATEIRMPDKNATKARGIAPDAQLLIMNIATEDDELIKNYTPAIEDAVKLGATAVNLSLGEYAGKVTNANREMGEVIKTAGEAGCILAIAAGNEGAVGSLDHLKPSVFNPDYSTVDTPAVADKSFAVASVENSVSYGGQICLYTDDATVHKRQYSYAFNSNSNRLALGDEKYDLTQLSGEDMKTLATGGAAPDTVQGKMVLLEKSAQVNAASVRKLKHKGAKGILVYNDEEGGNEQFQLFIAVYEGFPIVKVSRAAGESMLEEIKGYPAGVKISFPDEVFDIVKADGGGISDFSSWGLSDEGTFKPEITAPGGDIYSTVFQNEYGFKSGTSMATPHVAAGFALIKQRVDEEFPDLSQTERVSLTKQILMSTAEPKAMAEEGKESVLVSPRHQGAGVMKLQKAVNTKVVVSNTEKDSRNCSVILKDVGEKFDFGVRLENLSQEPLKYRGKLYVNTDQTAEGKFTLKPKKLYEKELEEVEIPAKNTKDVAVSVDIGPYAANLSAEMPNGYFVEGFVVFEDVTGKEATVSIPFAGFKGSWEELPVLEPAIYDRVYDDGQKKPFWYDPILGPAEFTHFKTNLDQKEIIAGTKGTFDIKEREFLPLTLSPNQDGKGDFLQFYGIFLRNYVDPEFYLCEAEGETAGKELEKLSHYTQQNTPYDLGYKACVRPTIPGLVLADTHNTWKFSGVKKTGEAYEDGTYFLKFKAKASGTKKDGSAYKEQEYAYKVILDTRAPEIVDLSHADGTWTFRIKEEGSGIQELKLFYQQNGKRKELNYEKKADGYAVKLPEGVYPESVELSVTDNGFNSVTDSLHHLAHKEEGMGEVKIHPTLEGAGTPRFEYRILRKENPQIEMIRKDRLPEGEYILQAQAITPFKLVDRSGEVAKLVNTQDIPFSIKRGETTQVDLIFRELKAGEIKLKLEEASKTRYPNYKDLTVWAVDVKDGDTKYRLERNDAKNTFELEQVPYGTYRIEIENLAEGFAGVVKRYGTKKETIDVNSLYMWGMELAIEAEQKSDYQIIPETVFEDGSMHTVSYEFLHVEKKQKHGKNELTTGEYEVYPVRIPDGYQAEPEKASVVLREDQKVQTVRFVFKKKKHPSEDPKIGKGVFFKIKTGDPQLDLGEKLLIKLYQNGEEKYSCTCDPSKKHVRPFIGEVAMGTYTIQVEQLPKGIVVEGTPSVEIKDPDQYQEAEVKLVCPITEVMPIYIETGVEENPIEDEWAEAIPQYVTVWTDVMEKGERKPFHKVTPEWIEFEKNYQADKTGTYHIRGKLTTLENDGLSNPKQLQADLEIRVKEGKSAPVQLTKLKYLVSEAEQVRAGGRYIGASAEEKRKAYDDAIREAEELLKKEEKDQTAVDALAERIELAKKELDGELQKELSETGKSLEKMVKEAEAVRETEAYIYAEKALQTAYEKAIQEGEAALKQGGDDQQMLSILLKITAAKNGLNGKKPEPEPKPEPNPNPGTEVKPGETVQPTEQPKKKNKKTEEEISAGPTELTHKKKGVKTGDRDAVAGNLALFILSGIGAVFGWSKRKKKEERL